MSINARISKNMTAHKRELPYMPIPKLKRHFDIFFSFILLVITSPLFIIILIAIFVENILRGHLFARLMYIEKRISQGKSFNFRKFNIFKSKVVNELRRKKIFIHTKELEHDKDTLTVVGKVLQKIYLDELPQLYSIFKGDISVVGPRPINLEVYKKQLARGNYTRKVMKSGLTGKFQSLKGMTEESQLKLDIEYIDYCLSNPSWKIVLYDLRIIFRTLFVMFRAQGI